MEKILIKSIEICSNKTYLSNENKIRKKINTLQLKRQEYFVTIIIYIYLFKIIFLS